MNESSVYVEAVGTAEDVLSFWKTASASVSPTYGPRVVRFLTWIKSKQLPPTHEALSLWLSELDRQGKSASYIGGNFFAVRAALTLWVREATKDTPRVKSELIEWSLSKGLESIKLPTVARGKRVDMVAEFRPAQLDNVIRKATRRISGYVEFLADTGVRVSEMTSIRLSKIQRRAVKSEEGIPFDFVSIVGKGSKERSIPIASRLVDRMIDVYRGRVFLFETSRGGPVNPDNVYKEVVRTFWRIEGIKITPHNLRHYFVTKHLESGAPPKALSKLVGHSAISTTLTSYDANRVKLSALSTSHHGMRGKTKGGSK